MEVLNNAAQTASKYIFGDKPEQSETEPMSRAGADGTAEESHSSDNKGGETLQEPETSNSHAHEPVEKSNANPSPPSDNNPAPPMVSEGRSAAPGDATSDGPGESAKVTPSRLPTQGQPGHEHQVDPPAVSEQPSADDEQDKGEELASKRDPNDHSGEPMKVHDGGEKKEEKNETPDDKDGSEEDGTGEKWVKSSGLAADGGDFDATKPGAGREADRLLEKKGIHKDEHGAMDAPPDTSEGPAKEKHGITQKIKDKLHIGHSKHD